MPASIVLHVLLALFVLVRLPALSAPAPDESVAVELVSPPERKPAEAVEAPPQPQAFESGAAEAEKEPAEQPELPPAAPDQTTDEALEPSEPPAERVLHSEGAPSRSESTFEPPQTPPLPQQKPDRLVEARSLYSKDVLSHPRVKQALGQLPPEDRIVQICGIEALEQIRRHRPGAFPDMLARDGGSISASSLTVSGGAFRSRARWYAIDFKCEVDAETMAVIAFRYATGGAIPESEWAARKLPRD